jgi:SWI/SNF-related matrix-associated actin-dependent regulator of chromatin subfamily A3
MGSGTDIVPLKLLRKRYFLLQDQNNLEVAILNCRISDALRALDELGAIQYEVYATGGNWTESIERARNTNAAVAVDVELVISGPSSKGESVGKILSKAALYLQHPRFLPNSMRYDNPHYISFSEIEEETPQFQNSSVTMRAEQGDSRTVDISTILQGLNETSYLEEIEMNHNGLITELQRYFVALFHRYNADLRFSHQRQALSFIAQREGSHMPPELSLWKHCTDSSKRDWYVFKIISSMIIF